MWHLESIVEGGRAIGTFVCIVPETGHRVTTDNGESLQRRKLLSAGRLIRLFRRTRAKQAFVKRDIECVMLRHPFLLSAELKPHLKLQDLPLTSCNSRHL